MSLSLSDVIALSSVGLGASALGLAIDAIMSPRLERFRDSLLISAEHARAAGTDASNRLKGEKELDATIETVNAYYDDLNAKRFSTELRCMSFFKGSIVRALLVALGVQTGIVFLATLHGMLEPIVGDMLSFALSYVPDECDWSPRKNILSSIMTSDCNGGMSFLAMLSTIVIAYTTYCLWKYLKLWEKEHRQLEALRDKLNTATNQIALYNRLSEFAKVSAGTGKP